MFKKFLPILFVFIGFGFLVTEGAHASVDISLQDSPEEKVVTVFIDSKDNLITGLDLYISHSSDVEISDVTLNENFCTLMGNTSFTEENRVVIECFNDEDLAISDVLANISYSTNSDDYFFYLDERFLDTGGLALGDVRNVNYGEDADTDESEATEVIMDDGDSIMAEEESMLESIINFLRLGNNYLYVIAGVIFLISITILVVASRQRSNE
jgi:hypothetical protein